MTEIQELRSAKRSEVCRNKMRQWKFIGIMNVAYNFPAADSGLWADYSRVISGSPLVH